MNTSFVRHFKRFLMNSKPWKPESLISVPETSLLWQVPISTVVAPSKFGKLSTLGKSTKEYLGIGIWAVHSARAQRNHWGFIPKRQLHQNSNFIQSFEMV